MSLKSDTLQASITLNYQVTSVLQAMASLRTSLTSGDLHCSHPSNVQISRIPVWTQAHRAIWSQRDMISRNSNPLNSKCLLTMLQSRRNHISLTPDRCQALRDQYQLMSIQDAESQSTWMPVCRQSLRSGVKRCNDRLTTSWTICARWPRLLKSVNFCSLQNLREQTLSMSLPRSSLLRLL